MTGQFFPYRFDTRWDHVFRLLSVKEGQGVEVTADGQLIATYGRHRIETTVANVHHTEVTGPHRWYTAVGVRLSFNPDDDGITFGTNHIAGLSIVFHEKIPRVLGFEQHSTLWVSVEDPAALARALAP